MIYDHHDLRTNIGTRKCLSNPKSFVGKVCLQE